VRKRERERERDIHRGKDTESRAVAGKLGRFHEETSSEIEKNLHQDGIHNLSILTTLVQIPERKLVEMGQVSLQVLHVYRLLGKRAL
jgi:hypothetical protein